MNTVVAVGHTDFWVASATVMPVYLLAGSLLTIPTRRYLKAQNDELDQKKGAGEHTGWARFILFFVSLALYRLTIASIEVVLALLVAAEFIAVLSLSIDWDNVAARVFVLIVVSVLTVVIALGVLAKAGSDLGEPL